MSDPLSSLWASGALVAAAILLALAFPPGPAMAAPPIPSGAGDAFASPAPPRIANRWDNLDHQPTQADVGAAEQEMGLARSADHDRAVDTELQQLGSQLLHVEQTDPAVNGR